LQDGPGDREEEIPISDINFLVERLEKLLGEAWHIPMSAYLIVGEEEFLNVIDQIRTSIPKEIKQAERILQEKEQVIAHAEEEAERILQQAREDAARMADDHEVIVIANQRAQTIVDRAHREAEALKVDADEYAHAVLMDLDNQLGTLETQLGNLMGIVRNGLEKISENQQRVAEEQG
jgi:F0F1-type ATP synthase membrane subunit b/b'